MDNDISKRVIACAFEVSNTLGVGFFEKVYEKALCVEMSRKGLYYQSQYPVPVRYKGVHVGEYFVDILVENSLLLELKAASSLCKEHEAQLLNYMKASGITHGLLLNFGTPRVGIKRMICHFK